MVKIDRTDLFLADVRKLILFDLASKNPYAADRYLTQIDQALEHTAEYPRSKQVHGYLGKGVRKILIMPYVVLYRMQGTTLQALRFLHSHQHITRAALKRFD